jgi:hypothetical protein
MQLRGLLLVGFALLTIIFASLSLFEYGQLNQLQSTATYHFASGVTIPVSCCPTLPAFIVENSDGNTFAFSVGSPSPLTVVHDGSTTIASSGVFVVLTVYQTNALPLQSQEANFTWSGTWYPGIPSPSNASLFHGAVKLTWFTNSSNLYLRINTR